MVRIHTHPICDNPANYLPPAVSKKTSAKLIRNRVLNDLLPDFVAAIVLGSTLVSLLLPVNNNSERNPVNDIGISFAFAVLAGDAMKLIQENIGKTGWSLLRKLCAREQIGRGSENPAYEEIGGTPSSLARAMRLSTTLSSYYGNPNRDLDEAETPCGPGHTFPAVARKAFWWETNFAFSVLAGAIANYYDTTGYINNRSNMERIDVLGAAFFWRNILMVFAVIVLAAIPRELLKYPVAKCLDRFGFCGGNAGGPGRNATNGNPRSIDSVSTEEDDEEAAKIIADVDGEKTPIASTGK